MFTLLWRSFGFEELQLVQVLGVEICVVGGDVDIDFATGFESCGRQLLGFVIALSSPGDIVGVAEGVDLQGADVGGEEGEVLPC